MIRNLILTVFLMSSLAACSPTSDNAPKAVAPPVEKPKVEVGPFNVVFNTANAYDHSFSAAITQAEGAVDYIVEDTKSTPVQISGTLLFVTGCDESQVTHLMYWMPDSERTTGNYVAAGSILYTSLGKKGILRHALTGLTGCENVTLKTMLKKR